MSEAFLALVSGRRRGLTPALLRRGLWLASLPYAAVVWCRNRLYDRGWRAVVRTTVPVVGVGNLTVGGTGKTPCVEFIARYYRGLDRRVAILSRGYGREAGRNDEALILEENLPDVPHLQGADRAELAQVAAEELESEVLVLDDGFQHRRLARDLDVVLIDCTNPWGHGALLPRGLLRESPRELRRAGFVLLTRCDQAGPGAVTAIRERLARLAPGVPVGESAHRPAELIGAEDRRADLESLRGRPVGAFCGIGNPDAFRTTLERLGAVVADFRTYPDHHPYQRADVDSLREWARGLPAGAAAVTTQKDLVKLRLPRLADRDLWAVRIRLDVTAGREELERRLRAVVGE
jgi:tetraacyldisaccharide 4'-kinase